MSKTLVHQGSTKDVYAVGDMYLFKFSDRYSVFDWGEMPDLIPQKGVALAKFSQKIYKALEAEGVKTHLINADVEVNEMAVKPFRVIRESFTSMPSEENLFIPLEVIFRLGVAKGSSLLKRSTEFKEGQRFAEPMIEFTTKLERFDRPLTHAEAQSLAGLNSNEWSELLAKTSQIALFLERTFAEMGIEVWDGKVEFAAGVKQNNNREIILVDSIGPDELRLTKNGVQLSKELIRQHYKRTPWYIFMEDAKKLHGENFKAHVSPPENLPTQFLATVSSMYTILADSLFSQSDLQKMMLSGLVIYLKESV